MIVVSDDPFSDDASAEREKELAIWLKRLEEVKDTDKRKIIKKNIERLQSWQ
jgi:hypothetical protein